MSEENTEEPQQAPVSDVKAGPDLPTDLSATGIASKVGGDALGKVIGNNETSQAASKMAQTMSTVSSVASTASSAVSGTVSALANPVSLVIGAIVLVLIAGVLGGIATYQTVGQNPYACKSAEDCQAQTECAAFSGSAVSLTGSNTVEKSWNYLKSRGVPDKINAALVGNFTHEAQVPWIAEYAYPNPPAGWVTGLYRGRGSTPESSVGGWGVAQWSFGRHAALKKFVIEKLGPSYYVSQHTKGTPALDPEKTDQLLAVQLEFAIKELSTAYRSVYQAARNASSAAEASKIITTRYEIPANTSTKAAQRAPAATEIFNKYSTGNSGSSITVSPFDGNSAGTTNVACDAGFLAGDLPPRVAARWNIMKNTSGPSAVPWSTFNDSSWHNLCPKVVDLLYGGDGPGRGYGNGNAVAGAMIRNGMAASHGRGVNNVPVGAVISWPASVIGNSAGHVAVYAGNGNIIGNDFGCPGKLCMYNIKGTRLESAQATWAMPSPLFDEGRGP